MRLTVLGVQLLEAMTREQFGDKNKGAGHAKGQPILLGASAAKVHRQTLAPTHTRTLRARLHSPPHPGCTHTFTPPRTHVQPRPRFV